MKGDKEALDAIRVFMGLELACKRLNDELKELSSPTRPCALPKKGEVADLGLRVSMIAIWARERIDVIHAGLRGEAPGPEVTAPRKRALATILDRLRSGT